MLQAEAKSGNLIQPNVFMLPGRIFSTAQAAIIWRGSFVEVSSVQRERERDREHSMASCPRSLLIGS